MTEFQDTEQTPADRFRQAEGYADIDTWAKESPRAGNWLARMVAAVARWFK